MATCHAWRGWLSFESEGGLMAVSFCTCLYVVPDILGPFAFGGTASWGVVPHPALARCQPWLLGVKGFNH